MKVTIEIILFKQRTLANGEHPIAIRLTQNRKRKYIRIGVSLLPQHWDETKNKPKNSCPNKEYIDNIITEKLSKYQKQVLEFQLMDREFTINQLTELVDKPVKNITVEDYLNIIINNLMKTDKESYEN